MIDQGQRVMFKKAPNIGVWTLGRVFRYQGLEHGQHVFIFESDVHDSSRKIHILEQLLKDKSFTQYIMLVDDYPIEPVGSNITLKWSYEDVKGWAKTRFEETPLTDDQCREILADVKHHYNYEVGVNWDVIDYYVMEMVDKINQVWQFAYTGTQCAIIKVSQLFKDDPHADFGDEDDKGWRQELLVMDPIGKVKDLDWVYFKGTGTECMAKLDEMSASQSGHLRKCANALRTVFSVHDIYDNRDGRTEAYEEDE